MYNIKQLTFIWGELSIKKIPDPVILEKKARLWALLSFLIAPLLPEYIAPLATLTAFCFLLKYFRSSGKKLRFEKEQILMLLFMGWQFIGIFRSKNIGSSVLFSFLWLFMFMGYIFAANLIDSKQRLEQALFAVTLSGGIAGFIGVGQIVLLNYGQLISAKLTTFFNPFWGSLDMFLSKVVVGHLLPANIVAMLPRQVPFHIVNRASSTFTNPVFLACFLVMVLPLAVYCAFYLKEKKKKWISLACIVMIVGGVACSYSRGPYLAVGITVFVMLFMGWKQALAILAITPVFLYIFPSGVYKRLLSLLSSKDSSIIIRSRVWDASMATLKERWVWGLGPGVGNVRDILVNQYNVNQPHAHNLFLQLYLEGGVLGGALFTLIVLWVIVDMIVLAFRSKEGKPFAVAILASMTGFLTCGFTDYVLYGPKILQLFMVLLGLALAGRKIYAKKTDNLKSSV